MRHAMLALVAALTSAVPAFAVSDTAGIYYVRYAIHMRFLPPLIGERRCVVGRPCDIVKLDLFGITLTAPLSDRSNAIGRLTIECPKRTCALKDGAGVIDFRKQEKFVRFKVDDREYPRDGRTVLRPRGEEIGEILLAY